MTLYLPTDEEAAEGIGAWNDTTDAQPLSTHDELNGKRHCQLHGQSLCLCEHVDNGYDEHATHSELDGQALAAFELDRIARANEHYLSTQLAHGSSPYALLSGAVGNTKVPTACGNYCGPVTVSRGAW